MATATATAQTATKPIVEAAEAALRREEAQAEARREMIHGDQRERAEAPEDERVRQAGQRPLLDHFALRHHFPKKLPDARPERLHVEIGRGARAAGSHAGLCEARTQKSPSEAATAAPPARPFRPRCVTSYAVLNVACSIAA